MTTATLKNVSIEDHVAKVTSVAERIKSDETQRFPIAATVGDCHRQGDVIITLLGKLPDGVTPVERPPLQLAPGNTQGSRHCLATLDGVTVYALASPNVYDGPILMLTMDTEVTHPEHANVVLPPGCYAISYQRTADSEGRQRRVED